LRLKLSNIESLADKVRTTTQAGLAQYSFCQICSIDAPGRI